MIDFYENIINHYTFWSLPFVMLELFKIDHTTQKYQKQCLLMMPELVSKWDHFLHPNKGISKFKVSFY